jgi:hypothetical protein
METIASIEQSSMGSLVALPGYQVYDYQLVLVLPEGIREKLRRVKQQFSVQFNLPSVATGAIMLPLVKFKQRQLLEAKLRHALQEITLGWRPFPVNLKDYAAQPTHTIAIPVTSKSSLQRCVQSLKPIQHLMRLDKEQAAFFPNEHQVIIASRLRPGIFEKAWKQYSGRQFTGQFLSDAALLLKRQPGDLHWQIAQRFEFRDLPVGIKQGNLFEV